MQHLLACPGFATDENSAVGFSRDLGQLYGALQTSVLADYVVEGECGVRALYLPINLAILFMGLRDMTPSSD